MSVLLRLLLLALLFGWLWRLLRRLLAPSPPPPRRDDRPEDADFEILDDDGENRP